MSAPGPERPGLQAERTALAWTRTTLGILATAALIVRAGIHDHQVALLIAGVAIGLVAGLMWALCLHRLRRLRARREVGAAASHGLLFGVTALTAVCGVTAGIACVLAGSPG